MVDHIKPLRLIPGVHRAAHRISVYLDRDANLPISQAEAHILTQLIAAGDSTVAQLHAAFGHRRSTLTSILDRLEERKFITRRSSLSDRRTFVVALTAAGRKWALRALAALTYLEDQVAAVVTAADLKGFEAVVEALARVEHEG